MHDDAFNADIDYGLSVVCTSSLGLCDEFCIRIMSIMCECIQNFHALHTHISHALAFSAAVDAYISDYS